MEVASIVNPFAVVTSRIIEETGKEAAMNAAKYRGICTSCRHCEYCTYQRDPETLVLQCAEFEAIGPKPNPTIEAKNNYSASTRIALNPEIPAGLCRSCDNYETCSYPKPEGGVWFCEEYK